VNSATAFAMAFGGGLDIGLSDRFAIRPAQVDYLYTRFNAVDALTTGLANTSTGHQNSFRYSGGIVIRF
jgi:opacity protein-like surface antigen